MLAPARGVCAASTQVYGPEALQHPYTYVLFLGQDARGDMVPCRQLRDKYGARRRDVFRPGAEPAGGGGAGDGGGDAGGGSSSSGGGGGTRGPSGGASGGGGGVTLPGIDLSSLDDA
jgi:hypothetical protein